MTTPNARFQVGVQVDTCRYCRARKLLASPPSRIKAAAKRGKIGKPQADALIARNKLLGRRRKSASATQRWDTVLSRFIRTHPLTKERARVLRQLRKLIDTVSISRTESAAPPPHAALYQFLNRYSMKLNALHSRLLLNPRAFTVPKTPPAGEGHPAPLYRSADRFFPSDPIHPEIEALSTLQLQARNHWLALPREARGSWRPPQPIAPILGEPPRPPTFKGERYEDTIRRVDEHRTEHVRDQLKGE